MATYFCVTWSCSTERLSERMETQYKESYIEPDALSNIKKNATREICTETKYP